MPARERPRDVSAGRYLLPCGRRDSRRGMWDLALLAVAATPKNHGCHGTLEGSTAVATQSYSTGTDRVLTRHVGGAVLRFARRLRAENDCSLTLAELSLLVRLYRRGAVPVGSSPPWKLLATPRCRVCSPSSKSKRWCSDMLEPGIAEESSSNSPHSATVVLSRTLRFTDVGSTGILSN